MTKLKPFKAIIFDCDGVLIDSEIIACEVEAAELTAAGWPCTAETIIQRFLGRSLSSMFSEIEDEMGKKFSQDFFMNLEEKTLLALKARLKPVRNIIEVVGSLLGQGHYRLAVASSSTRARLQHNLGLTNLWNFFDGHIYSAEEVKNAKPAPDLFLAAAAGLGIAPQDCIVIEDSSNGIKAATAAQMQAIGFVGGLHCLPAHRTILEDAGALLVLEDMKDLLLKCNS
ncbi:MAG: HAD family hydrolase [Alphaproteobacteria bacterium]